MEKFNLNKIIEENLNKAKFQSKAQPSLPADGWLNGYRSGGTYISDRAQATQFGQYKMGGGMFPPYHSYTPPRMNNGGWLDQYQVAGQVKQRAPIYTDDPNDFRRWQDSGKKYIQGLERLEKARKQIKTSINAYSPLRGLGSLATSASNFFTPGKKVYPKYKEKVVPLKKRWTNDPDENQPISDVEIGDKQFYDAWNPKTILGYSAQNDYNIDTGENDYDFYTDVYQYAPPTRQNLQLLPPPGKKINKPKPKPKPKPEPTLKPKPFVPATKIPMGEPSMEMQIQQRKMPNLNIPPVQLGKYKVDYFDPSEEDGVQGGWHTKSFITGTDADEYMKQRNTDNKVYGPSMTQRVEYKNGGGLLSRTVTCSRCGHSWKGVTGGIDPITCHKCGGMIKMQNGGDISIPDLDGYQLAGQVRKLSNGPKMNSGGYDYEKELMTNVNPYLQSQMELAKNRNINTGIHNGPLDAIRHAGSAAGTATEVFPSWLPAPLKIIGANVLGAAHEFTAPGSIDWQETGSDLYNNFVGSIIGSLPISNYKKQQMVVDAQKNGILSNVFSNVNNKKINTVKQKKQKGGMITDPMGQWAHPGQNTRIPGGNITMQGVPYPVLAKASNGMSAMMYPEQEYSFPGADYVDEYPMMQQGGSLPKAQFGCNGKSCTQTGEGMSKVGGINSSDDTKGGTGYFDWKALNTPVGWNDLLTYNSADLTGKDLKQYNKDITARTKSLQTQFPGLTEDQLRAAGADSARIRLRMQDLPRYDKPIEQTYDKAYHQFYRPLMNQSTPVTVPQILQYQSQQPGGLNAFQQMVTGNYGRKKAQYGGWLDKYQEGGGTEYTVKKGDTLTKIGKQFGMTAEQLKEANNISNIDFIRTNQRLNIPRVAQQVIADPVDSQYVGPRVIEQQPVMTQQQQPTVFQKAPIVNQNVSVPVAAPTKVSYPNLDPDTAGIVSKYTAPSNSDTPEDVIKRQKAKKLVELARQHIAQNKYYDVPADVAAASLREGKEPAGCIGGSCTLAKEAGILPKVYWSNTAFAADAPNLGYPNNGNPLRGIQNLEEGDFMVYKQKKSGSQDKEGKDKFIPSHFQTFLGINPETKQWEFFDNYNKRMMSYPEETVRENLKQTKNDYDYGAVIYKNNPFHPAKNSFTNESTQEAINTELGKAEQLKTPTNYKYSIRPDAKEYNNSTKIIMDKFVNYANDDKNLNNLVDKMGASKEEIHDSLLNVFGELGQENNWSKWGKSPKSKIENLAEKAMVLFGGGKKYSVGPGQNKFNSIPADIKEKFGIKSTKDLYDMDKVIPLMVAQDLLNKKTLRIWGEQNTLSDRLIGHTDNENPLRADDLKGGVGRWSPYLRNEFGLINSRKRLVKNNDLIPWNTEAVSNYDPTTGVFMNPRKLDEGSYPDKVFHKTDDNLQRIMINPGTEANPQNLSNFIVLSKTKKKAKKEFGGQTNWLNNYK